MRRLACLCWLLASCLGGCAGCRDIVVERVDSPSGGMTAILFNRDCGATTGFSTQVSVLARDATLSGAGNVFVADANHGAAASAAWGGPWAELKWLSPTHLLILFDEKARVFTAIERQAGIEVTFQKLEAPATAR